MTDLLSSLPTRIAVSLPANDLAVLSWQADRRGVHVEEILREAVAVYLLSVRPGYRLEMIRKDSPLYGSPALKERVVDAASKQGCENG
jgi:hypothetical protein